MRKSFDGLFGIIKSDLNRDVRDGGLFMFLNQRLNRIKILSWDTDNKSRGQTPLSWLIVKDHVAFFFAGFFEDRAVSVFKTQPTSITFTPRVANRLCSDCSGQ
jgi:hypothetical protein